MNIYIPANKIYNGVLLGAKNISIYREELNRINKFPVPDNDTGDNLHYLMSNIRKNLYFKQDVKEIMSLASDLAVVNSRGNSGAIFSQFFVGFEKKTPNDREIHIKDFIACFKKAYDAAYNSINEPIVDGTILIAIKTWAEALEKNLLSAGSFDALYDLSIKDLKSAVKVSKNVFLKERGTENKDAGALAFIYFIEGFMSAIVFGEEYAEDCEDEEKKLLGEIMEHEHDDFDISSNRFCTEVLLEKNALKIDKKRFEELGDCLVVSESKTYAKVHLHTDEPSEMTKIAGDYGKILESKCDDIKIQSLGEHKGDTALLIDSIADIPVSFCSEDTYVLPVNILVDNVSFKDKRTVFSGLLNAKSMSSSQPNNAELDFVISKILGAYDRLIILSVSSKMSGLYEQYKRIIAKYDQSRIELIDSKVNSVAEGLLAYKAISMLNKSCSYEEIIAEIYASMAKTKIFVSLKSLDRMLASGRLNEKVGKVMKWLNFLPVITINEEGKGKIYRPSFSNKKARNIIMKNILDNADRIETYGLVHCHCLEESEKMAKEIEAKLGFPPAYISEVSSVIEIFSGKGSIAVGYTLK